MLRCLSRHRYYELLKDSDQLDYYFDVRYKIKANSIVESLLKMMKNLQKEKKKIRMKMD